MSLHIPALVIIMLSATKIDIQERFIDANSYTIDRIRQIAVTNHSIDTQHTKHFVTDVFKSGRYFDIIIFFVDIICIATSN